ncbi:MAG: (d)CMP kinase [Clostridia bacterium]|nr:(d)CMP kinase [Clostridia bacterium]
MDSIAIDGPGGVGKSTIAKKLALHLDWFYLNSGLLYRAFAFECLKMGLNICDEQAVLNHIDDINIELCPKKDKKINLKYFQIFINGKNCTKKLHNQKVDKAVAYISKIKQVREKLTVLQKNVASKENLVMEGRDIGTAILKDSKNKFYLDASPEERARRRFLERSKKDKNVTQSQILQDLKKRDEMDKNRRVSPLKISKDAICVDTTNLTINEVVAEIIKKLK